MHIPDGMLSNQVAAAAGAVSVGFVGYAVRWVKRLDPRRVVLMAVMAALVFALQMLNFPVAGGTSGHFAGGAAAGILLGAWPAMIVMTTVLFVQALMGDGGILALGANVLNLGVIAPLVGVAVYGALRRMIRFASAVPVACFVAAWSAVVVSALAVAVELWLAGRANLAVIAPAMGGWHALIGVGEGIITAGIVGYVFAARPDLAEQGAESRGSLTGVAVALGGLALVAAALSFAAASSPDALEFVAAEQGLPMGGGGPGGLMAGYAMPGITDDRLATVLAAIVGVVVVGIFAWAAATAAVRRRRTADDGHAHPHHHADEV